MQKYIFILGSHPQLSCAELEAVLDATGVHVRVQRHEQVGFVETQQPLPVEALMERLGGTVKIGMLVGEFEEERMSDWIFDRVSTDSKFHFGFSVYPLGPEVRVKKDLKTIHRLGLGLKKTMREAGISARFVSATDVALSSVIVHKERLLKNGVEILLLKDANGRVQFGYTLAVQPFAAFSKRDYGRPGRDVRSGMLPPKVARMMLNLARPEKHSVILDPMCGSGTVLQEALLMGYSNVIGSDASAQAIRDTKKNLAWLKLPAVALHTHTAERLVRDGIMGANSTDRIVFEGYLGPPTPYAKNVKRVQTELTGLYRNILGEMAALLRKDGVLIAALPFWKHQNETHLPIAQLLKDSGLQLAQEALLYRRPNSIVGREIIIARHR